MAQQLVTVSNLPMLECDSEALLLQDGYRQVSSYKDRDDISRDLHISQHSNLVRFSLIVNSKRRDSIKKTLTLELPNLDQSKGHRGAKKFQNP
ncbi:hypothetical protein Peur_011037 [Populus x canadensis]